MYVVLVLTVWAAMAWRFAGVPGWHQDDPVALVVLAILAFVSVMTRDASSEVASSSFTTVVLLSAIPLVGPLSAGILGLLLAVADRRYAFTLVGTFNGAMIGTMTLAGGMIYTLAGGAQPVPAALSTGQLLVRVGLPLFAADLAMCLVNVVILAGMVIVSGGRARSVLQGAVRQMVPLYLAYGLIAFVFIVLWGPAGVGPLSAVLIAAPLTIAWFVYVQYGDEVRARARILTMFTTAVDTADGRLAAHARRVEELVGLIAADLGLPDAERLALQHASALHDLGMKAAIRAGDGAQAASGYADPRTLTAHPALAADALTRLGFLHDAGPAIRAHHERFDGRGYPDGLAGRDIPLGARILAVADAFDALTTTRGERVALDCAQALAELRLSAGTQLDPEIVEALARVMSGRAWAAQGDQLAEGSWLWDHHTLPAMSDAVADLPAVETKGSTPPPAEPVPGGLDPAGRDAPDLAAEGGDQGGGPLAGALRGGARRTRVAVLLFVVVLVLLSAMLPGDTLRGLQSGAFPLLFAYFLVIAVAEQFRMEIPGGLPTSAISAAAGMALAMNVRVPDQALFVSSAEVLATVALAYGAGLALLRLRGRLDPHDAESALDAAIRIFTVAVTAACTRDLPLFGGHSLEVASRTWPGWQLALVLLVIGTVTVLFEAPLRFAGRPSAMGGSWQRSAADELRATLPVGAALTATGALVALSVSVLGLVAVPLVLTFLGLTDYAVRRYARVRETYAQALEALAVLPEMLGYVAAGHSRRVSDLARLLARRLRLSEREVDSVVWAARVHDLGQLELRRPLPRGATVQAAPADQQRIAEAGARLLRSGGPPGRLADLVRDQAVPYHRIMADGDDVAIGARIIKVANAFDDYGGALTPGGTEAARGALERIYLGLGYEYDPRVVEALSATLALEHSSASRR